MVKEQLHRGIWPVTNRRVLRAMRKVPRECFVPDVLKPYAYRDSPLPIGWGQTISQPYMVGLMSQLLSPAQGERILEIGTGSGYQAAILAEMGAVVYTLEVIPELSQRATHVLDSLGYTTITLRMGNGFQGWPEEAPFDGIILTCATDKLPEALRQQLKKGGKVVIPMGNSQGQWLTLLTKREHVIQRHTVAPVRFVPMTFENAHPSV
jgi:protein-L-isoaspartate(D-aspartate) O-methyltransferase